MDNENKINGLSDDLSDKIKRGRRYSISVNDNKINTISTPPPHTHQLKTYKAILLHSTSDPIKKDTDISKNIIEKLETIHHKNAKSVEHNINILPTLSVPPNTAREIKNEFMIPEFYKNLTNNQTREMNYLIDSIRNMKKLNKYQVVYLDTLTIDELKTIVLEYDKTIGSVESLLNNI